MLKVRLLGGEESRSWLRQGRGRTALAMLFARDLELACRRLGPNGDQREPGLQPLVQGSVHYSTITMAVCGRADCGRKKCDTGAAGERTDDGTAYADKRVGVSVRTIPGRQIRQIIGRSTSLGRGDETEAKWKWS